MNLTDNQLRTLKELGNHECFTLGECAKTAWENGESYYIDDHVNIPYSLRCRFKLANEEALTMAATRYQVLVHTHKYGCTTYVFPPLPSLNNENAIAFLGADFDSDNDNIYVCHTDGLSYLK